jgi:LysR family glycine cleavage system transcriptional activator
LLYRDEVRLYCAPNYVKELRLQAPSDLVRASLLHTTLQPHWKSWLHRFSVLSDAQIDAIPRLHFDQALLAIEAARYGHGAVLSSAILTEAEVRDGALCEPFEGRLPVTKGYYVVHHKGTTLRPAALAFKNWLLQVVGSEPSS